MFKLEPWHGKHGLKERDVESRNSCHFVLLFKVVKVIKSQDLSLKNEPMFICTCTQSHISSIFMLSSTTLQKY